MKSQVLISNGLTTIANKGLFSDEKIVDAQSTSSVQILAKWKQVKQNLVLITQLSKQDFKCKVT